MNISLTYNLNLYRHSGSKIICETQMRVVECLIQAIELSINKNIKIIVFVNEEDFKYFKEILSMKKSFFCVKLLGKDSLNLKKPYLRDILNLNNYKHLFPEQLDSKTSFCIYANADICIPKYFFELVFQQLNAYLFDGSYIERRNHTIRKTPLSPDCFVFNRRDIVDGKIFWHPGSDLFLFPAHWLQHMYFGDVCIGLPPIAAILWLNCLYFSEKTVQISNLFTTSHYGDDEIWREDQFKKETYLNFENAKKAFLKLINHDPKNITRFDLTRHSILPKKRIERLIKEWINQIDLTIF